MIDCEYGINIDDYRLSHPYVMCLISQIQCLLVEEALSND